MRARFASATNPAAPVAASVIPASPLWAPHFAQIDAPLSSSDLRRSAGQSVTSVAPGSLRLECDSGGRLLYVRGSGVAAVPSDVKKAFTTPVESLSRTQPALRLPP